MEKRTLLAILLSMVVMVGFLWLQSVLYPPPEPGPSGQAYQNTTGSSQVVESAPAVSPRESVEEPADTQLSSVPEAAAPIGLDTSTEEIREETVVVETDLLKVTLSNSGGDIVSFKLKNHLDRGEPVEMIFAGNSARNSAGVSGSQAFSIAFGNMDDVIAKRVMPINSNFRVRRISNLVVEFSRDFRVASGGNFTLTKRYEFKPGEYMFELAVGLNGGASTASFDFQGAAYTLFFAPQIGPGFEKLDQRYEYRRYMTYKAKLKTEKVTEREPLIIENQPAWAAITGKYFALIALPYANQYTLAFSALPESGLPNASRLYITRPAFSSSRLEDKYHFYMGPKNQETLSTYNRGDNGFKLLDTDLFEIANTKGFLAPLEKVLKWLLQIFYKIIPNYGVAIILVTLVVRLLMFPLTKKGSESTLRMQALSPKIKEIQTKYKDNPQKMNAEMAEFYKKEGYNPLSGCLPMIIQIPIFFAMYNLFNNHFDLRGAMFIPGWIPDLSAPEAIYNFQNGFKLPILGWTAIRLLPFIYVGSQLLYGKVTQTPDQQGNTQMKFMLYVMPIAFFFILYDVPSGLLIYWIMSNVLTLVQQVIINKFILQKKAVTAEAEPKPVIAPSAPRRRRRK
jgi:YidC/Oxa1 family membrane protein insertase